MPDGPLNGLENGQRQPLLHKQSVDVFVRHTKDCAHQSKGRDFRKCQCPKYLYIYKDGAAARVSAKTGAWAQAEKEAQKVRDSWIPELVEPKRLRAEKEMGRLRIEEALGRQWISGVAGCRLHGSCGEDADVIDQILRGCRCPGPAVP